MKYFVIILFVMLTACSSKYDECIEQQKTEYRERNPKASYALIQNRQFEFEMSCSKFKGK